MQLKKYSIYYVSRILCATDFLALFILHIVIAGNGILVSRVAFGDRLIITGMSCHLCTKFTIK